MKSDFALRVLKIVSKIPKGSVMTYADVARKAGNLKACRAVGNIMSGNYNPKVPCHRVISSDGTIGNYNRGGSAEKVKILRKEGVEV
jgi:methylated-DNA-[protein]-cysteine S-methyltransferase